MNNLLMAPQGAPTGPQGVQPQQPPPPSPEQIAAARAHMQVIGAGLMDLASRPLGSLTKRDVYNALGEMIAQGAFGTPQAKQQLVAQMAEMPDDETAIRQIIGKQLLQMGQFEQHLSQFGDSNG